MKVLPLAWVYYNDTILRAQPNTKSRFLRQTNCRAHAVYKNVLVITTSLPQGKACEALVHDVLTLDGHGLCVII